MLMGRLPQWQRTSVEHLSSCWLDHFEVCRDLWTSHVDSLRFYFVQKVGQSFHWNIWTSVNWHGTFQYSVWLCVLLSLVLVTVILPDGCHERCVGRVPFKSQISVRGVLFHFRSIIQLFYCFTPQISRCFNKKLNELNLWNEDDSSILSSNCYI